MGISRIILCVGFLLASVTYAYSQETAPVPPPRPANIEQTVAPDADAGQVQPDGIDPNTLDAPAELDGIKAPSYDGPPQPLIISARAGESGQLIPAGLQWRIYSITPNESGQLELLARSEDATANFSLPAGPYIAHVAYGRAQASDTITVEDGPTQLEIILDVGGLKLNAAIKGDVAIPARWLRFTVFSDSAAPGGRKIVAQAVTPQKTLHLNSGTYSIISNFGGINATARADLQVVTGELTSATLYHDAAIVNFKLVSEPGGEAIVDTTWVIKTLDGETIFQEKNAFPQTVLAEGEYILIAKLGTRVYNREFEVVAGLPREIEVITSTN